MISAYNYLFGIISGISCIITLSPNVPCIPLLTKQVQVL